MSQKKVQEGFPEYNSGVVKYEADLLELIKNRSGLENAELTVQHAFSVFDQCIPELGQFSRLIKLIRDQLYEAVYSEKLTECGGKVSRLPYFKIIESSKLEATKHLEEMVSNVETITNKLFQKEFECENLESELKDSTAEIRTLHKDIKVCIEKNEDLMDTIKSLERNKAEEAEHLDQTIRSLRLKNAELKHQIDVAQDHLTDMEKFQSMYTALDEAFSEWPSKIKKRLANQVSEYNRQNGNNVFRTSTDSGRHEAGRTISEALTKQLEELEKQLIDQYENDCSKVKSALVNRRLITDNLDPGIDAEEEEMTKQAKNAVKSERDFVGFMNIATNELNLLRQHKQNLEALKIAEELKANQAVIDKEFDPDDQSKDVVPTEPVREAAENPFVPNETMFSKYSIIVQVSQDGVHFYDLPVNEPCGMCGLSAVLVCPHHILSRQVTIPLTPSTAYLRIVRPQVRSTTAEILEPTPVKNERTKRKLTKTLSTTSGEESDTGSAKAQVGYVRPKPRDLTEEKSLTRFIKAAENRLEAKLSEAPARVIADKNMYGICEDLLAFFLSSEYTKPHKPMSCFDNFFNFLESWYCSKNAAHLVAGDLIHNVPLGIENGDRYMQLLAMMLNGSIDSALLKYLSLLADAVLTIDWRHPADYWAFACVVYPFLDEEDNDIIQMNFTSFTEGNMCVAAVLDYQLFCTIKGTEQRYQHIYEQLHEMSSGQPSFSEDEYLRAVRDILPKLAYDYPKAKAMYQEAYQTTLFWNSIYEEEYKKVDQNKRPPPEVDFYVDGLSTERVAQICCYLDMLAITESVKENLWTRVLEVRTSSAAHQFGGGRTTRGDDKKETPQTRLVVRHQDIYKEAIQYGKFKAFKRRENIGYVEEVITGSTAPRSRKK